MLVPIITPLVFSFFIRLRTATGVIPHFSAMFFWFSLASAIRIFKIWMSISSILASLVIPYPIP
jgi:hypothetical protein